MKLSGIVFLYETLIYAILLHLHDCTFKNFAKFTGKHIFFLKETPTQVFPS